MNCAVVIPTYNRRAWVLEAASSALAQTAACRVVVVDDGSTDGTAEALSGLGDGVEVLRQENRERGAARNAGAARADDADLLFFLDADDVMEPDHVERLAALAASRPRAPLVASGAWVCDERLRPLARLGNAPAGAVTLEGFLLGRHALPPSVVGVRRGAFEEAGGFPERRDLAGSEDWLFTARVLAGGHGVRDPRPSVRFRRHEGNTMGAAGSMHGSMMLAHRLWFGEEAPERAPATRVLERRSRARLLVQSATAHYGAGRTGDARRLLAEAVRADPSVLADPTVPWTWARSLLGPRLSGALRAVKRRVQAGRRGGGRGGRG